MYLRDLTLHKICAMLLCQSEMTDGLFDNQIGGLMTMKHVEACIAWAAQQGYVFAEDAAHEYGMIAKRIMRCDQPYYNSYVWRDKTKEEARIR